ncbi:MAG: ABC transporter substrate-binding protein, partial [Chloroflexi bacterium]|nr:ABC transporter substrate-binding protein [Chloroflexota bacterium]
MALNRRQFLKTAAVGCAFLATSCASGQSPQASGPAAAASSAAGRSIQPLGQRAPLRLAVTPGLPALPLHLAIEKGYLDKAGFDVDVTHIQSTPNQLLPVLAKGDMDISQMTPGPPLFNQLVQGFDIRVPASLGQEKSGRASAAWLMVNKNRLAEFKDFSALRGKTVEASVAGTSTDLISKEALHVAGLVPGKDATLTYRAKGQADWLALARSNGADAIAILEPVASQTEKQTDFVRWKSLADVAPWYMASTVAASSKFVSSSKPALSKFLEVFVTACREINASGGNWTPELVAIAAKWGQVNPSDVQDQGGVPYFDPNGQV